MKDFGARPISVYIENAHDPGIGGFTIPLPTTQAELQPFLEGAGICGWHEIKICDITSDIDGLGDKLYDIISEEYITPNTMDELNYLAARLGDLDDIGIGREIMAANIESGKNCGSLAEIINLTYSENLNCFDCWPAFSAEQYGDILINQFLQDAHAIAFNRLEKSDDPDDRALAAHIEKLETHSNLAAFGHATAKEEGGVFTKQGYLVGGDGLQTLYRDSSDIPDQRRLLTETSKSHDFFTKIENANIPEAIIKLHAIGCRSMEGALDNVKIFLDKHKRFSEGGDGNLLSNHYLLILNRSDISITPALEVYKSGSESSGFALSMTELAEKERPDIRVFAVRINDNGDIDQDDGNSKAGIMGDLIELHPKSLHTHITRHAVMPNRVDVLHDDGTKKSYDLFSWSELLRTQKGETAGLISYHYSDDAMKKAAERFGVFMGAHEMASIAKSFEGHLPRLSAAVGEAASGIEAPHPDMIRIANTAAKEILAWGDADIYRIIDKGSFKLSPLDAARAINFGEYNLAIKQKDAAGLDHWAKRKVSDIVRKLEQQAVQDPHTKLRREEL